MKKFVFCVFFLFLAFLPLQAQENYPFAWLENKALWLANLEAPPILVAEQVLLAAYSPQQTRLAYLNEAQNLIVIDPATQAQIMQIDRLAENVLLGNLTWQGENTLWFNLFYDRQREGGSHLLETSYELWWVDTQTGASQAYPQKGIILADGERAVLLEVGKYGESPARLSLLDADLQFAFPAPSTGSHGSWLPRLGWTETAIYSTIPAADLLYQPDLPTQLFRFDLQTGEQSILGEIQTPFPAEVIWSPDGASCAYFSVEGELLVYNHILDETRSLAKPSLGAQLIDWSEQGLGWWDEHFYLWQGDEIIQLENIWATVPLETGFLFLQGLSSAQIIFWQEGKKTVIAEDLSGFEISLVGR